ncbi:MAG: Fic family protein, partial [Bdellovibrionota bacterium]
DRRVDGALGIAGLIYDFQSAYVIPGCSAQAGAAFRLGDSDASRMSPRFAENDPTERLRIGALFSEITSVVYADHRHEELWPESVVESPADLAQWSHQSIFGCDPAYYAEDISPVDYEGYGQENFEARWNDLLGRFSRDGNLNPLRIKDLIARRFINRPDWQAYLDSHRGAPVNPDEVYDPKPATWQNWLKVADQVDEAAREHAPLTEAMLLEWNKGAILNTVPDYVAGGVLKSTPNYGANLDQAGALRPDEIEPLLQFKFDGDKNPAMNWEPLLCAEELPKALQLPTEEPDCKNIARLADQYAAHDPFWKQTQADLRAGKLYEGTTYHTSWYWYACWPRLSTKEALKRATLCGMIIYPSPQSVQARLAKIIGSVNDHFAHGSPKDSIEFALKTQRELVALHPFNKGNGRVSRWVMDYITARVNLPPILVQDMNKDLSTEESVYLEQGKLGLAHALKIMEKCLARYEDAGRDPAKLAAIQAGECGQI